MKWKITVAVLLVGLVAIVLADVNAQHRNDADDRQTMIERRKEYVRAMNREVGEVGMSLAGVDQDELVFDADGCGPTSLRGMIENDRIVGPLMIAGFRRLRCKDTPAAVDVPVR